MNSLVLLSALTLLAEWARESHQAKSQLHSAGSIRLVSAEGA